MQKPTSGPTTWCKYSGEPGSNFSYLFIGTNRSHLSNVLSSILILKPFSTLYPFYHTQNTCVHFLEKRLFNDVEMKI